MTASPQARIGSGAVLAGGAVSLGTLVVVVIAFDVIDATAGIPTNSNWVFAFYAVALAGLIAGARVAAIRRPDAPLMHGLLASVGAYAVLAVTAAVGRVVLDRGVDPVALAFNGLIAASAGVLGTVVAERRPRERP